MKIVTTKDGDGFLAEIVVDGKALPGAYTWGKTEATALQELKLVVEGLVEISEENRRKNPPGSLGEGWGCLSGLQRANIAIGMQRSNR